MKLKQILLYPFLHRCPLCGKKALFTYKCGTYSREGGLGGVIYSTNCLSCNANFYGDKKSGWREHYQTETKTHEIKKILLVLESECWEKITSHICEEDQADVLVLRET